MIILEENFKWHLEAFASELFIYKVIVKIFYNVDLKILLPPLLPKDLLFIHLSCVRQTETQAYKNKAI